MLMLNDLNLLNINRHHYSFQNYLIESLKHIDEFQYQNPTRIFDNVEYLRNEIGKYATFKSPIYSGLNGRITTKADFNNKELWFTDIPSYDSTTGGSTTGNRFEYKRWAETYHQIEGEIHYKGILKEFNLDRKINILYFMLDRYVDRNCESLIKIEKTNNPLISHGMGNNAVVHTVIRNKDYYNNYYNFYKSLLTYLTNNKIDVILTSGNLIGELNYNSIKLDHKTKICSLLSSTGCSTNRVMCDKLITGGLIDNWCDHMRCWDGGATFFTCRYKTPHLLDGLSWVRSDNERLISDDYYSLASPFVNYWNGDYAAVSDQYEKCKCGRYYREFKIGRTRDFAANNINSIDVSYTIDNFDNLKSSIIRTTHLDSFLRIFTNRSLSSNERSEIRAELPSFEINFITEG